MTKDTYEVGYKRPPQYTRFKKGQSGNPKGRPRGAKSTPKPDWEGRLGDMILSVADKHVTATENGKPTQISTAEAILKRMAVEGAKGNTLAGQRFLTWVNIAETEKRQDKLSALDAVIEYKRKAEEILFEQKRKGLPPIDMVPHPDHLHINGETGEITISGPMFRSERAEDDRRRIAAQKAEITYLEHLYSVEEDADMKQLIEKDISQAKVQLDAIIKIVNNIPPQ